MLCSLFSCTELQTLIDMLVPADKFGLGGSKDPIAIEALIGAIGDKGKLVKGNAARQLKGITGQDFGK